MSFESVSFSNRSGHRLAGRIYQAGGRRATRFAVFAHCFTCSKSLKAVNTLARRLAGDDLGVLSFDFTGLGHSEGEFADSHFSTNISDISDAVDWLNENRGPVELLIGHSLGGAAVLHAAGKLNSVRAVAVIGAPFDPGHVKALFADSIDHIRSEGSGPITIGGRQFTVNRQFLDELEREDSAEVIKKMNRPLLVMHSPVDNVVGIENATAVFSAARHPRSYISLDDADHLLTRDADARYAADVLAKWSSRYLSEVSGPSREGRTVVINRPAVQGASIFTSEVQCGRHTFTSDEPVSVKGADLGPAPYDFLLTALGACTAMTLRMYALQKDLPIGDVTVDLRHDRVHADDCSVCESEGVKVDRIIRKISFAGELEPAAVERLMQIADRCPVHRTLHSEIVVETSHEEA